MTQELLPTDLVLDEQGHLTDVGVTTVADGQHELLPPEALLHADTCPRCASLVADEALRSVAVQQALSSLPASLPAAPLAALAPANEARRLGREGKAWVAGAAVLGLLGLLPAALSEQTRDGVGTLLRAAPALWRVLRQGAEEGAGTLEKAAQAGALALWVIGIGLAIFLTRQRRVGHEGEAS